MKKNPNKEEKMKILTGMLLFSAMVVSIHGCNVVKCQNACKKWALEKSGKYTYLDTRCDGHYPPNSDPKIVWISGVFGCHCKVQVNF